MNNGTHPEKEIRNILEFNELERKQFLESFDLVLTDCDGVVWFLADAIPDTGKSLKLLKQHGKDVKFISNNSLRSDEEYMSKIKDLGLDDVTEEDIVHPVKTLSHYIQSRFPEEYIFSLCSETMNESFVKNGIKIKTLNVPSKLTANNIAKVVIPKDKVAAVVLDCNFDLTFAELAMAHQYLSLNPECLFLVGAPDEVVPIAKHETIICSSGLTTYLQNASKKDPIIMGKPSAILTGYLCSKYDIKERNRVLFIGDNLKTDIEFGLKSGFQTLLVLSGATTMEQVCCLKDNEKPDYIANSLADFIEFFQGMHVNGN